MNNINPLDRFTWDGIPTNPTPQQPTPQQQTTSNAAQGMLGRTNAPKIEPSDDEMDLNGRVTPPQSFEEHKEAKSENGDEIENLIEAFQEALTLTGEDKIDKIQDTGLELIDSSLTQDQIEQLTAIQTQALATAAQNGDTREALLSLVRFSPVRLSPQILSQTIEKAFAHGHLDEICEAYLDTVEDLARESLTEDINRMLSALQHPLVPSDIQKVAIGEAIYAGLSSEENSLSDVLKALDGFKPDIQIDPIRTVLTRSKKSITNEQRKLLSATLAKLTKTLMKSSRRAEMGLEEGSKRSRTEKR